MESGRNHESVASYSREIFFNSNLTGNDFVSGRQAALGRLQGTRQILCAQGDHAGFPDQWQQLPGPCPCPVGGFVVSVPFPCPNIISWLSTTIVMGRTGLGTCFGTFASCSRKFASSKCSDWIMMLLDRIRTKTFPCIRCGVEELQQIKRGSRHPRFESGSATY